MENTNNPGKFSESWKISAEYLKQGFNLIPVWDGSDKSKIAKTPCTKWKQYQDNEMSESMLFTIMTKKNTTATAFVTGYNRLEVIDVDEKNWTGISVMLFAQLQELLPDVWKKLRIHKTPSEGYHLIYKISDNDPEGNRKLAYKEGGTESAIESRGKGGYALSNASLNYSIYKNNPIPTITWLERCSMFVIAESFNQKVKVEAIKPKKEQSDFYEANENPFDDFNAKDGGAILSEYGWKQIKENNQFIWYVRPGKSEGISASFNKQKNIYFIFSSSTEFEPSCGYFPSMVLSKLQFSNDNKEVYRYLVEKGFGRVNKAKEIKYAAGYAKKRQPLPNNFSADAKKVYEETTKKIEEAYPFGEFIKFNGDEEKMEVSREDLYQVAEKMGFRTCMGRIVKIEDYIVRKCTERQFYDEIKAYIKDDDHDNHINLLNIWEKFIQKNGAFTQGRLPEFDTDLLIKDDRQNAYQFFANCYIHITSSNIQVHDYADFKSLVFEVKIRNRDFVETDNGGDYLTYLDNAVGYNDYTASIIGFLVHDFKDETTGFIPVLTEQCEDPTDGGGSGKNVFCNLLSHATTFISKNCASCKYDEKFFQVWTGQRIMALSDLPENFDFGFIKEATTGTLLHKRLFKDEMEVPVEQTPKILCQTNYSVEIKDGGIKRRVRILEFTDFYTLAGGIDNHHGKHFPNDWSKEDWLGFDNVIARSLQIYLRKDCKIPENTEMTESGWLKQFKQTHGPTATAIIQQHFNNWVNKKLVSTDEFNKDLTAYFEDNKIQKRYEVGSVKMNKALNEYCKHHGVKFVKDHNEEEKRYRKFEKNSDKAE